MDDIKRNLLGKHVALKNGKEGKVVAIYEKESDCRRDFRVLEAPKKSLGKRFFYGDVGDIVHVYGTASSMRLNEAVKHIRDMEIAALTAPPVIRHADTFQDAWLKCPRGGLIKYKDNDSVFLTKEKKLKKQVMVFVNALEKGLSIEDAWTLQYQEGTLNSANVRNEIKELASEGGTADQIIMLGKHMKQLEKKEAQASKRLLKENDSED